MKLHSPAILFHRGDSCPLPIIFRVGGEPYILSAGDVLYFGVFQGRKPVLVKRLTVTEQDEDGALHGAFKSSDTSALRPGEYEYEMELVTDNGTVYTAPRGVLVLVEDRITPEVRGMADLPSGTQQSGALSAAAVSYSNQQSNISADDVQAAIDFLATRILPTVTAVDNGKILCVVGGQWAVGNVPYYEVANATGTTVSIGTQT